MLFNRVFILRLYLNAEFSCHFPEKWILMSWRSCSGTKLCSVPQMEEEAERLRQPPVKPEPEEEREHKPSREERERERARERDRRRAAEAHPPSRSDDDVEDGEEVEDEEESKPCLKPTMRPIMAAPSVSSASGNATPNTPREESPCGIIIPHENSPPESQPQEEHRPKIGLSLKLGEAKCFLSSHYSVRASPLKLRRGSVSCSCIQA